MKRILLIDDDELIQSLLRSHFAKSDRFHLETASDGSAGLRILQENPPDLVILDVKMPDLDGIEVLRRARALHPSLPVVMLTAVADVKLAVQAIQVGAFHFLSKPVEFEELEVIIQRALEREDLLHELENLRHRLASGPALERLIGESAPMKEVKRRITQVAMTDVTVVVQGPTGSGKELVARALHEIASRRCLVVFHSNLSVDILRKKALESGVAGFMPKQDDPDKLVAEVRRWVKMARGS